MTTSIRCDVCFESYSLDLFRFLPACGHGLCIICSEKTASKPNCAICRHPKNLLEPVQIYLTLGESSTEGKANAVVEDLRRIGPDSLAISVEKAGRKIRNVVRDIEMDNGVARELLDAAKDLDERIHPLFLELDLANATISSLNAEVEGLQQKLKAADVLEGELKQARRTLAEARASYKSAVNTAEQAKDCVVKERADNARLKRTVERQLSDLRSKEEENTLLRAKLTKREKRILLLEKKLKLLSRPVKHPKPDVEDPDESLQVENSAEGIRVPRKSNDWLEPRRALRTLHLDEGGGVSSKRRTIEL
ncbi:hypothetical protein C8J57DRAFT_1715169 [Mycena rebaudengoi]|nr:hypothetical protein C8J57DRAFT_1715169 [Mycena rebaudengoi]